MQKRKPSAKTGRRQRTIAPLNPEDAPPTKALPLLLTPRSPRRSRLLKKHPQYTPRRITRSQKRPRNFRAENLWTIYSSACPEKFQKYLQNSRLTHRIVKIQTPRKSRPLPKSPDFPGCSPVYLSVSHIDISDSLLLRNYFGQATRTRYQCADPQADHL